MTYTTWSGYHVPRSKKELLSVLLPAWEGRKTDLRQMSIVRLRAIYHKTIQERLRGLMK